MGPRTRLLLAALAAWPALIQGSDADRWDEFNQSLAEEVTIGEQRLAPAVAWLFENADVTGSAVLDIGSGLGKNAIPFFERGCRVTLVDMSPWAIDQVTKFSRQHHYGDNLVAAHVGRIEDVPHLGWFDLVVGTYVFSFLHPTGFDQIMGEKVFGQIKPGGYFAGDFFGENHGWSDDTDMTFLSEAQIRALAEANGMVIVHLKEIDRKIMTVAGDLTRFHVFAVVAKKADRAGQAGG